MRLTAPFLRLAGAFAFAGLTALVTPRFGVKAGDTLPAPFDPAAMDRSADACKNFFQYATGAWRKAHPIPPAYSEYGYTELLEDQTRAVVRGILETAQRNPGPNGGATQKIGTFYGTCMDTAAIEQRGLAPMAGELQRIAALRDRSALPAEVAHLQTLNVDDGFSMSPTQDLRDSSLVIAELDQGGLGLPERDYYLRTDADSRKLLAEYRAHVAKLLALSGDGNAQADARLVLALETAFARASTPAADLRDPEANYHPLSVAQTQALMPHFPFQQYLTGNDVTVATFLNVAQPNFLKAFDVAVAGATLPTWRAYLRWRLLDAYATVAAEALRRRAVRVQRTHSQR